MNDIGKTPGYHKSKPFIVSGKIKKDFDKINEHIDKWKNGLIASGMSEQQANGYIDHEIGIMIYGEKSYV